MSKGLLEVLTSQCFFSCYIGNLILVCCTFKCNVNFAYRLAVYYDRIKCVASIAAAAGFPEAMNREGDIYLFLQITDDIIRDF